MRLELKRDDRYVADHPGVVTRLDHVSLTRSKLDLGAVLMGYAHSAGLNNAHVPSLAAVCASDGLHALRPAPAGLECETSGGCGSHVNHVHSRLIGSACLIR
jgi:hypothetical protein